MPETIGRRIIRLRERRDMTLESLSFNGNNLLFKIAGLASILP